MATAKQNYQDVSEKLEEVMAELQSEDLDVDSAIKLYEKGLELVRQLETKLGDAENKVRELKSE
jgi:exodeoxyribonuclease VII small subunit